MADTALAVIRDVKTVTDEINNIYAQAEATARMLLAYSVELGRRLCEVKEMIPHGGWGDYLKAETKFSQTKANDLMRLYREYGDEQGTLFGAFVKSQTFGNLDYSKALLLLALPAGEREAFVAENDVESASVRDLKHMLETREREAKKLLDKRDAENAALKDQVDAAQREIRDAVAREKQAAAEAKKQAVQKKNEEIARLKASIANEQRTTNSEQRADSPETEALRDQLEKANAERDALQKQVKAAGRELAQAQVHIDATLHSANKYLDIVKTMRAGDLDEQHRAGALTQAMLKALETIDEQLRIDNGKLTMKDGGSP